MTMTYNHRCPKCGIRWTHENCMLAMMKKTIDMSLCGNCGGPSSNSRIYEDEFLSWARKYRAEHGKGE